MVTSIILTERQQKQLVDIRKQQIIKDKKAFDDCIKYWNMIFQEKK